jgi:hypothetical protein
MRTSHSSVPAGNEKANLLEKSMEKNLLYLHGHSVEHFTFHEHGHQRDVQHHLAPLD